MDLERTRKKNLRDVTPSQTWDCEGEGGVQGEVQKSVADSRGFFTEGGGTGLGGGGQLSGKDGF